MSGNILVPYQSYFKYPLPQDTKHSLEESIESWSRFRNFEQFTLDTKQGFVQAPLRFGKDTVDRPRPGDIRSVAMVLAT